MSLIIKQYSDYLISILVSMLCISFIIPLSNGVFDATDNQINELNAVMNSDWQVVDSVGDSDDIDGNTIAQINEKLNGLDLSVNDINNSLSSVNDTVNTLPGTVLYSGLTTGTVTLSANASGFKRITIYFRDNDAAYGSVDIDSPNGKTVRYNANANTGDAVYVKSGTVSISGKTITWGLNAETQIINGGSIITTFSNNVLYISKVVGYNY